MTDFEMTAPFALGTFSSAGGERFAAVVVGDSAIAVRHLAPLCERVGRPLPARALRLESVFGLLEDWAAGFAALDAALHLHAEDAAARNSLLAHWQPVGGLRMHPPVDLPRQIMCTGANYFKHVVDLIVDQGPGANPDTEGLDPEQLRAHAHAVMTERSQTGTPYAFAKAISAVTGPFDPIVLPAIAQKPDWELELGVVISRAARNVRREDALSYIAGYTVVNDVTARDLVYVREPKALGTDWVSAKSAPTFLPMGPYLVPAAFVKNPQDLRIQLKLNGQVMQDESTSDMIFDVARQIEHISSRIQLLPGDLICTGSPAGNGTHYKRFLRAGDVVEGAITGLGVQRNVCQDEAETQTRSA